MRIGIDIDNVISDMTGTMLEEYLEHDKTIRNTGVVNDKARIRFGMFDWTKEEEEDFYYSNIERIAAKFKLIPNSKETIDKLKQDGNEIYIITGRDNGEYKDPWGLTTKWLEEHKIYYDKLILTDAYNSHGKTAECQKHNIDIMIDDNLATCLDIQKHSIPVLVMNTRTNMTDDKIDRVNNWDEIYEKICSMYSSEKINLILDTDAYNECDDQFALAYMLKSQDKFNIQAITIAPYYHKSRETIEQGIDLSYDEVLKICNWLKFDAEDKVFKGSRGYVSEGYNETNEAVEKIIEISLNNEKTYIIAIGAITNIALAIMKEPRIIDKIEIVWLGGHSPLSETNNEYNFRQDVQAVKVVFESKAQLTVIPCKNVASNLKTTIYELEHHLKGNNELCDYLCSRFYNDGYHGLQTRRTIWDIAAVAYLINKDWFEVKQISCPEINEDMSYNFDTNNHIINMTYYLNPSKIYEDLFKKIKVKESYDYDVYLGGTCNNSSWRDELIAKLDSQVKYKNPQRISWSHEIELSMRKEKERSRYILYVITSEMIGVLAIANVVDLANRQPEKVLFCVLKEGFDKKRIKSLDEVEHLLEERNVKCFKSLDEIAEFLNRTYE